MTVLLLALALQAASAVPTRTVAKGWQSHVDEPRQVVVHTAKEWSELGHMIDPDRQLPELDFSREMVVGVFLGTKPTSGFGVEIAAVRDQADALVVQYREAHPHPGLMVAQVLSSPYHLVAIPKRAGDVKFERIE
jgi:hypothetical protein